MKTKFGSIIVDGRGKIGGHVASKNRAGSYLRTKVTPVNPNTSSQQVARGLLTNFAQAWRALTAAQRAAWNAAVGDFAKTDVFGDLKTPTGFNLYVRLNTNLSNVGEAAINLPPLPAEVSQVVASACAFNLTGDVGTVTFSPTVPADHAVIVRATPSLSPGKSFVKSEYRVITVLAAAATSPADIWAAYVAKFGEPTEGAQVFVSLETVNTVTGQKSTISQVSAIVANA